MITHHWELTKMHGATQTSLHINDDLQPSLKQNNLDIGHQFIKPEQNTTVAQLIVVGRRCKRIFSPSNKEEPE